MTIPGFRWWICSLLFLATALSFFDRQVLSILAPAITRDLRMDNIAYSRVVFAFILSYSVMFAVGGRLLDRLGTRRGLLVSVAVWTASSFLHMLARGAGELAVFRFLLGAGEGGCFPGSTKGALEWFPKRERAAAVGFANGGSAFGAVLAPPLTVWIASLAGWRGAFAATGLIGLAWIVLWSIFYRAPKQSPFLAPRERRYIESGHSEEEAAAAQAAVVPWRPLLRMREVWGLIVVRFLLDPVFYFYMFWIPQYLSQTRHASLAEIGRLTWIPFLTLGVSNMAGGWLSDALVRGGFTVNAARKSVLAAAALLTPISIFAVFVEGTAMAIALMSVLMFAHGFWITNYMTLIGDLFPGGAVGTVIGLSGSAGGIGGFLSSLAVGVVVQRFSFTPVFVLCGILYPLGLAVLLLAIREIRPLAVTPAVAFAGR
jgi:ACS family hexuronate transporter-like MFS transporter